MKTHNGWHAVALSKRIKKRPVRVCFEGLPVVLFRGKNGLTALMDRCPHRHVELSKGRLVDGDIECPYHGWRFGGDGQCTAIPALIGECPKIRVPSLKTTEAEGVVFLTRGTPREPPYTHPLAGQQCLVRRVQSTTETTLIDAAENILDATHTHFTHKGLLRGLSSKRNTVTVDVTGGTDWVEAVYSGEDEQQGLISRLFESKRARTLGRFRFPGIVELEYWGPDGLTLATTFHLREGATGEVEGIGFLVGEKSSAFSYLKAALFPLFFRIALEQDRRVLSSAKRNAAIWPKAKPIIGPLDFLRQDIEAIQSGKSPASQTTSQTFQIEL